MQLSETCYNFEQTEVKTKRIEIPKTMPVFQSLISVISRVHCPPVTHTPSGQGLLPGSCCLLGINGTLKLMKCVCTLANLV